MNKEQNEFKKSLKFKISDCFEEYPKYAFDYKDAFFKQSFLTYCAIKEHFPELDFHTICRIKSFDSTYTKAQKKSLDRVYDIHGMKHIIHSVNGNDDEQTLIEYCYKVQDFLKKYYNENKMYLIPTREKDYIKEPKENGYQALHLSGVVIPEHSRRFETQIKTARMEEVAKYGNANHALKYKPREFGKYATLKVPRYATIHDEDGKPVMKELTFEECFQYFYNVPFMTYRTKFEKEMGKEI